uniref:Transmembrane protein 14C n=1 Tax=Acrobeloides nanus TaxID=290746 RepID=A0A914D1F4_9BILA
MPADIVGLIYAGLVTAGGVIGYIKSGSIPSLVAGGLSGLLAGYGAINSNFYILTGVAIFLGGLMGSRYLKSGKFMPPGLIAVLSLILLARCLFYFTVQRKQHAT